MNNTPPPLNGTTPPKKKSGFPWWAGCLIAAGVGFMIIPVLGILAAIAIPNFVAARDKAQSNACVANMKMIEVAKEQLILEGKPAERESVDQITGGTHSCPAGGSYEYNDKEQEVTCSVHGTPSQPTTMREARQRQRLQAP